MNSIHLTRVLPGYYSWNSPDYKKSATVIKSGKNWLVEITANDPVFVDTRVSQLSTAANLNEARSIIAEA